MALIIPITGKLNRERDVFNVETVAMGPHGHTSMAWERVPQREALLIVLRPEKFYDHLRRKRYVFALILLVTVLWSLLLLAVHMSINCVLFIW